MTKSKWTLIMVGLVMFVAAGGLSAAENGQRWSAEAAWAWYQKQPWLVGFNYIPATAINDEKGFQPRVRRAGQSCDSGLCSYEARRIWSASERSHVSKCPPLLAVMSRRDWSIRGAVRVHQPDCSNGLPVMQSMTDTQ
jgi:hypothetical protein